MASGESKGSRRYDKENLLWQSTVAIKSDPVGSGSFKGLCARGGWVVDCKWKDGTPVNVVLRPANALVDRCARPEVRFGGRPLGFTMKEVLK